MSKTIEFVVLNGNARKHFSSIEEFKTWAKDKLPNEGDEWKLEEIITQTKQHTIPCEKKRIVNTDVIKRIIDTFIEKANVKNVKSDFPEWKMIDPKYNRLTIGQAEVYYMAEQLGYPWEKLDNIYANKDGIMNHRWDSEYHGYDTFEDREFYTNWLAPFFIIKDVFPEYNIDEKDITIEMYNYGHLSRSKKEGKKYIHYDDKEGTLAGKYPKMMKYYQETWHSKMAIYDNIYVRLSSEEYLEEYKKRIKEFPIDKITVEYNVGDYKPCHNYKLEFPHEFDPKGKDYWNTVNVFSRIPGIMFRNEDIYITNSKYVGRHVHHRATQQCDIDEKLYEYCTKNLK